MTDPLSICLQASWGTWLPGQPELGQPELMAHLLWSLGATRSLLSKSCSPWFFSRCLRIGLSRRRCAGVHLLRTYRGWSVEQCCCIGASSLLQLVCLVAYFPQVFELTSHFYSYSYIAYSPRYPFSSLTDYPGTHYPVIDYWLSGSMMWSVFRSSAPCCYHVSLQLRVIVSPCFPLWKWEWSYCHHLPPWTLWSWDGSCPLPWWFWFSPPWPQSVLCSGYLWGTVQVWFLHQSLLVMILGLFGLWSFAYFENIKIKIKVWTLNIWILLNIHI